MVVEDIQLRYYRALGGTFFEWGEHGPGTVEITNKNVFVYTCHCGKIFHDIRSQMEHQSPEGQLEIMDIANWVLSRVYSYDEWMKGINEDKYILPPFINFYPEGRAAYVAAHQDPSIARK